MILAGEVSQKTDAMVGTSLAIARVNAGRLAPVRGDSGKITRCANLNVND